MKYEHLNIMIEGEEISDIYPDLLGLEVELDDNLANMFRIQIPLMQQTDGQWKYLDDERFSVWNQIIINAGFENGTEELISGYITHIRPCFYSEPSNCSLEIWGMDGSILMDRKEILKEWTNKKDSDIASEIFSFYGFKPEVDDTEIIHDEAISTIIQRETDMQFLQRLAVRNGFECFVDGSTGYFHKPRIDQQPQPLLAVHFGEETNVKHFSIQVDALTPVDVSMFQVDRVNKETLDVTVESSTQMTLGNTKTVGLLNNRINPGKVYIGNNTVTGNPEMNLLCEGLFHQSEWFVTAEGEISANLYGHILKPRGTVTIKGIGETHSGIYYVTHVTHSFNSAGYTQMFRVKRNAIKTTGSEDFSASAGFPDGLF